MIEVEIITIGDELLIGQVVDTNSSWMAIELNKIGLDVKYKTTVGDDEADILEAFERSLSRVSITLVTGGIGPTKDDITKKTLCRFFQTQLIFDERVLTNIQKLFSINNRSVNELTRDQAYVPQNCTVIQNQMGTAPITWFERKGRVLVSMPGVPYEMKWAMTAEVLPRLKTFFLPTDSIQHQTLWVKNYSESQLALHLDAFENELPECIKLAYLPIPGLIRLRMTGKHVDETALSVQMDAMKVKLLDLLEKNVIAQQDDSIEVLLGNALKERNLSLSLAESCTGGKIASMMTSMAGSSHYFKGSVVAYANEIKQQVLHVKSDDLTRFGAVSEPIVRQMASGIQQLFRTDCSIATSGIAGPDGGTEEKPVGTVWVAVACGDKLVSRKFLFSKNREHNISRASHAGILMLLELLNS